MLIAEPLEIAATRTATVIGFVHFFVRILTRTIYAKLLQLKANYERVPRDLEARPVQVFRFVILRLTFARSGDGGISDLRPTRSSSHFS